MLCYITLVMLIRAGPAGALPGSPSSAWPSSSGPSRARSVVHVCVFLKPVDIMCIYAYDTNNNNDNNNTTHNT